MIELTGNTHLYALLAHPVGHVRAPVFVNPVLEDLGLDAFLVVFHVTPEALAEVVAQLPKIGNLKGIVLTIPHKQALAEMCDELGERGRLIGAVNAVRFDPGGRLAGDMFDGVGFVRSADQAGIELRNRRILLVGAGGAGRAVAFACAQEGAAELTIANRTHSTAVALAEQVAAGVPGASASAGDPDPAGYDVVVNATSLGLSASDALPVDPARLDQHTAVIDIIVPDTPLQQQVAARGNKVLGGRPMAVLQIGLQMQFLGEDVPDA